MSKRRDKSASCVVRTDDQKTFASDVLDEVFVGRWLHLEQMDRRTWWASIGDAYLWVTCDTSGRAKKVTVERGQYESPSWPEKPKHRSKA